MTLWLAMAALTALVLAFLLRPLLRPGRTQEAVESSTLAIYRDQLAEVDRDAAEGLIGHHEADAARREIARRLLAADKAKPPPSRAAGPRKALAVALLALLPAAALGLYLGVGAPELPGRPLSGRGEELAKAEVLAAELREASAAVKADPQDALAWRRLGLVLVLLGEVQPAVEAIQTALSLGAPESETWAMLAGAIIERRGGEVPPMARQALAQALQLDPENLLALFLTGFALRQDGKLEEALELWLYVAEAGGEELTFRPELEAAIRAAAEALGRPPPL